jgi:large subunit ribosomal protein L25
MSMAEQMVVENRVQRGKLDNRRLRRSGKIPAVLYGHGLENVCLAVTSEALSVALRHGSRLVDLTGAVSESAFIRDMQWDTWGTHVLHVDFTRISADEVVEVTLTIELRGEAPGVRSGGVVDQLIHDVEISCPAGSIPEKLQVNINHLKLDETITLAALQIPQGAKLLVEDMEAIVVQCIVPQELPEEGAGEAVAGEPEVIGAKKEEEGEEKEE